MTLQPANKTMGRVKLLVVLGVFAIPFVIASLWFNQLKSSGGDAGNRAHGSLVDPARPLLEWDQSVLAGSAVQQLSDIKDQWTLLYFRDGDCDERCQKTLYDSRQVRVSLGREMHRMRRLIVTDTPVTAELQKLHLQLLSAGPDKSEKGLRAQVRGHVGADIFDADPEQLYLVDPLGNLMMRFPSDLPQKLFLKDLKVLLKASRIG